MTLSKQLPNRNHDGSLQQQQLLQQHSKNKASPAFMALYLRGSCPHGALAQLLHGLILRQRGVGHNHLSIGYRA